MAYPPLLVITLFPSFSYFNVDADPEQYLASNRPQPITSQFPSWPFCRKASNTTHAVVRIQSLDCVIYCGPCGKITEITRCHCNVFEKVKLSRWLLSPVVIRHDLPLICPRCLSLSNSVKTGGVSRNNLLHRVMIGVHFIHSCPTAPL